ncbi:MAG: hypothetical protein R3E77_01475 [Steroidobacteraceae bacterium]
MSEAARYISIDTRFRGPSDSANGGFFCGMVARFVNGTARVRLHAPPPLRTPLQVMRGADGAVEVTHGERRIATAGSAVLDLVVPAPTDYMTALECSRHYAGFNAHAFEECFVCGPARRAGDGLRLFAGPAGAQRVAAPWRPDASLAGSDGKIAAEYMYAALDCPGYFVVGNGATVMLLGEFTAHVDRVVHVDEPCVVIGWHIASEGRKHRVGTAVFDEDGELCGRALGLWIAPRAPAA